jgi:serine/threonine protein kinase
MAIKVMRVEDKRLLSKLEQELELLKTLKHAHIVQYYGCLIDHDNKEASIFMELMPHSL